jgi:hypothetical protein
MIRNPTLLAPTPTRPLPHWPLGAIKRPSSAGAPRAQDSLLVCRRSAPLPPSPALRPAIQSPVLQFDDLCPPALRNEVLDLYRKVEDVACRYGLGTATPTTFSIHYIKRKRWSSLQYDRDKEMAKQFPISGLRAMWTRLTRWLSRLAHAWTTPIYFERDSANDIYIIAENFRRQNIADKNRRLAEVLVRCLQRASYPDFFEVQHTELKQLYTEPQADARLYTSSEALVEMNVRLCLDALKQNHDLPLEKKRWLPDWLAFWRSRPDPESQSLFLQLRGQQDIDTWFRKLFFRPVYTRLLFQKGDVVELSDKDVDRNGPFLRCLKEANPYGGPRIKRYSERSP